MKQRLKSFFERKFGTKKSRADESLKRETIPAVIQQHEEKGEADESLKKETISAVTQQHEEKRETDQETERTKEASRSIYEYIKMNTKGGALPENFKIPWLDSTWIPGARDGTILNHMAPLTQASKEEREEKILAALKLLADGNGAEQLGEVFSIFEKLDEEYGIARLYDEILATIFRHSQELDFTILLMCADELICRGTSLLAVKLGLIILSRCKAGFVEKVMTEVGIYDEFTYYAARTLSRHPWAENSENLFELAKKTHGWGRIHAVNWLRPDTQEIREWLLLEGSKNTVNAQYSADLCLQKADAKERLEECLSAEEYKAIGQLIRESLEPGGPCPGLTGGEQLLTKYVERVSEYPTDLETLEMILTAADEYNLSEEIRYAAQRSINIKRSPANAAREARIAPFRIVGNVVRFGRYEQNNKPGNGPEEIEWIVLDVQDKKSLLLSRYLIDNKPYNAEVGGVHWETCTLRAWLNKDFMNAAFTAEEQSAILTTYVDIRERQVYSEWKPIHGKNPVYEINPISGRKYIYGPNTRDKLFLLSNDEVSELYFANDSDRMCAPTDYAIAQGAYTNSDYKKDGRDTGWWWLRQSNMYDGMSMFVSCDGKPDWTVTYGDWIGVRPAFWISLESGIFSP